MPEDQAPVDVKNDAPANSDGEPDNGVVVADSEEVESALPYPVVAIGASAGGLEAYMEIFNSVAPDTGMSFVLLPHLAPDYKSLLVDIIARHTPMQVQTMAEGIRPEPNQIYILPPNKRATLNGGVFHLEDRAVDRASGVIDSFFRSLAADQRIRAVGVVLSGSDSDGALGLKTIKGEGGIAIVQSPDSAKFPDMPRTSISADHVDRVLPPAQIGTELAVIGRYFADPALRTLEDGLPQPGEEQSYIRIVSLMRTVSGIDFRLYKPSTIRRRIARRMVLRRIQSLAEYAALLQNDAEEARDLQEDALINVTRFFRDPSVFAALKEDILPRLLAEREPDSEIRIWVAGCSTGEEAYSIAICLLELLTGQVIEPLIQIFGTDASDQNILKARTGIYQESIAGDVSPERLQRFFVKVGKGYQVAKRVRDQCIFARQNVSHDPPFSRMDLISCRNVLIYLMPELQNEILPTFHYALRPNGYLLLGTSETIREFTDMFQLADRKNKFFIKIGNRPMRAAMALRPRLLSQDLARAATTPAPVIWNDVELQRAADRIVLARYGPPGVVVDEKLEIVQSRGHTSPFLEMPQGAATLQLPEMLRDSIAGPVTNAVNHAVEDDVPVRVEGLHAAWGDDSREITLEVLPIHTMAQRARCFLVLFAPGRLDIAPPPEPRDEQAGTADTPYLTDRLRLDLASTRLYLQTLLEERDARNQVLVSANEEIQSTNEELQSTNEELETTKEELQSSNEELQTVNDELAQRNFTLSQTTNDLANLLNSVNLPVLMLSHELHIRHFTPPAERLMNLRRADVGRPLSDIRLNLQTEQLEPMIRDVLESLTPREVEVQDRDGHWYLLRVRPYRTSENRIDGAVVVLVDIDQLRRSQNELRQARDFAGSVIENVPLPLAAIDRELKIRAFNKAFRALTGLRRDELENRSMTELAATLWGLGDRLRENLESLRETVDAPREFVFEHTTSGEIPRIFNVSGRLLLPDAETFVLVTVADITAQKETERLLKLEREKLTSEVASATNDLARAQVELRALTTSLFHSQDDEGRRLARELHDDICQRLAVLEIAVQQIAEKTPKNQETLTNDLERVRGGIDSLTEAVRRISHGLHPTVIPILGLVPAIRSLVEDFREREHMIVTLQTDRVPEDVPIETATGLYRITQEALRNVAKHAGRTHVKVSLKGDDTRLRLQINDAGEGFDPQTRRGGLGLISMEERARMMRGRFGIESKPGEGARVEVEVPLGASEG